MPALERSLDSLARELVRHELGEHHEADRPGQLVGVVRRELEDRVDREELDPGPPVQLRLADGARDVTPTLRAGTAVAVRIREQLPVVAEQPVVHGPPVDSDRRQRA